MKPLDGDQRKEYVFAAIPKEEHQNLSDYLRVSAPPPPMVCA